MPNSSFERCRSAAACAAAAISVLAAFAGALPAPARASVIAGGSLTTVDPRYDLTHVDLSNFAATQVTAADDAQIVATAAPCVGAVADGATDIVLMYTAPSAGEVTFSNLSVSAGGTLRRINSMRTPSDVPTQDIAGQQIALAVYTAPDGLPAGLAGPSEPIEFQATFTPKGGVATDSTANFALVRAPVLLVHGLWSGPQTWLNLTGPYPALQAAGFDCFLTDYSSTDSSSLSQNRFVLMSDPGGILDAYAYYRSQGFAITRVDVVAHSMGGLVARELVDWPAYKSEINYGDGYIRRLITIATPNDGSPLATLLEQIQATSNGQAEAAFLSRIGFPTGPAVADLEPGSHALTAIGATPVSAFAEVGEFEPGDDPGILGEAYSLLGVTPATVFSGEPNDLVVSDSSQEGGIAAFKIEQNLTHLTETSSAAIGSDVVSLLEGDGTAFASGFPAPPLPATAIAERPAPAPTAAFATIASPKVGQVVGDGANLSVSVAADSGFEVAGIVVAATEQGNLIGLWQSTQSSPTSVTAAIPIQALGSVGIQILAENTLGQLCLLSTHIVVTTSEKLTAIALQPASSVLTSVGSSAQLQVSGLFADAISRDITRQSATHYSTGNPGVATVGPTGLIAAVGNGSAVITVSSGTQSAKANVGVALARPEIFQATPAILGLGQTAHVVVQGANFGAASALTLLAAGAPDALVSIANLTVAPDGRSLSANITVSSSDTTGSRTLAVTTPGGQSDPLAPGKSVNVQIRTSL